MEETEEQIRINKMPIHNPYRLLRNIKCFRCGKEMSTFYRQEKDEEMAYCTARCRFNIRDRDEEHDDPKKKKLRYVR